MIEQLDRIDRRLLREPWGGDASEIDCIHVDLWGNRLEPA